MAIKELIMPVITIRGTLGSSAPEIGKLVAEKLHIDYVDREIIAEIAERLRRQIIRSRRKKCPLAVWRTDCRSFKYDYPSQVCRMSLIPAHIYHLGMASGQHSIFASLEFVVKSWLLAHLS